MVLLPGLAADHRNMSLCQQKASCQRYRPHQTMPHALHLHPARSTFCSCSLGSCKSCQCIQAPSNALPVKSGHIFPLHIVGPLHPAYVAICVIRGSINSCADTLRRGSHNDPSIQHTEMLHSATPEPCSHTMHLSLPVSPCLAGLIYRGLQGMLWG